MSGATPPSVPSDPAMTEGPLVLSWAEYQGRNTALASWLGGRAVHLGTGPSGSMATAPIRYLRMAWGTVRELARSRPRGVVIMLPPFPALVIVAVVARVRRLPVVADLHSGVIEEQRWRWALRPTLWIARRIALSVVTNEIHEDFLRSEGVTSTQLHDPPEDPVTRHPGAAAGPVLVPSSYGHDEPVAEVLGAARLLPEVRFALTGRAPDEIRAAAPDNVEFTGFVERSAYDDLVRSASAVCCLTTDDNTMQRGGYEALAAGVPLVTSDFAALRRYFDGAAVHVAPDAAAIAKGIATARAEQAERAAAMRAVHARHRAEFAGDLGPIAAALGCDIVVPE